MPSLSYLLFWQFCEGEASWLYNSGNGRAYADLSSGSPTTYTYNASHKHAVASLSTGETYSYDANGNMTSRTEGGLIYTQTFDAENRLISVTVSGQTTQFIYDGDGNLIKKIKPDGSKTLYVGGIYEVDKTSGGTVTQTRTYYPAGGAMRIGSTLYYVLKDHLGSASVITDASGVTVSGGEQRYYPFGESRLTATMLTDKLFTGQREMAGLGIYHYGARFYSPKLGRFLSPDSIVPSYANPQSLNRFSYVTNNPLRYTDPTGHMQAEDGYISSNGTCNADDRSCNWVGKSKDKRKKDKDSEPGGTHPPYIPTPTDTTPPTIPTYFPTPTPGSTPTSTSSPSPTVSTTPFAFTPTNTLPPQPSTNTPTSTLTVTPSATITPSATSSPSATTTPTTPSISPFDAASQGCLNDFECAMRGVKPVGMHPASPFGGAWSAWPSDDGYNPGGTGAGNRRR